MRDVVWRDQPSGADAIAKGLTSALTTHHRGSGIDPVVAFAHANAKRRLHSPGYASPAGVCTWPYGAVK